MCAHRDDSIVGVELLHGDILCAILCARCHVRIAYLCFFPLILHLNMITA